MRRPFIYVFPVYIYIIIVPLYLQDIFVLFSFLFHINFNSHLFRSSIFTEQSFQSFWRASYDSGVISESDVIRQQSIIPSLDVAMAFSNIYSEQMWMGERSSLTLQQVNIFFKLSLMVMLKLFLKMKNLSKTISYTIKGNKEYDLTVVLNITRDKTTHSSSE